MRCGRKRLLAGSEGNSVRLAKALSSLPSDTTMSERGVPRARMLVLWPSAAFVYGVDAGFDLMHQVSHCMTKSCWPPRS